MMVSKIHTVATLLTLTLSAAPATLLAQTSPYQNSVSITEVMPWPSAADEISGQWVELQNLKDSTINLQGMVVMTMSLRGFHTISPSAELLLEPGGVLVIGARTEMELNGGAPVTYSYGNDIQLNPESDLILLFRENQAVDAVYYGSAWGSSQITVEEGFSLNREPSTADELANWCLARVPFGAGDYGTPGDFNSYCDDDLDTFAEDEGDCDDGDSAVRPGATEFCNGIDDDCDQDTDEDVEAPPDACPVIGVCSGMVPECSGLTGWSCNAVPGWEKGEETLCDGRDNDCDGATDEKLGFNGLPLGAACIAPGECGAGIVVCSPARKKATCSSMPDGTAPGSSEERCDELDNDCDGDTDEGFNVGGPCSTGLGVCEAKGIFECDDSGLSRCNAIPGRAGGELCGDRLDNDCDGFTDEGFLVGKACHAGTGSCRSESRFVCSEDLKGVVCPAVAGQPGRELCQDGLDNDCDGDTDEDGCDTTSGSCSSGGAGNAAWPIPLLLALALLYVVRLRPPRDTRNTRNN